MSKNKPPIDQSKLATESGLDPSAKSRSEKLTNRRFKWKWNYRLLVVSIILLGLVLAASTASYLYHSSKTADAFLLKAEQAETNKDYSEQSKWLGKYSMLRPDDIETVVDSALAAHNAIATTDLEKKSTAIHNARQRLGAAIGKLDAENDLEQINELRRKLIDLQLQLAGPWYHEAEKHILKLNAPPDDAQATKWLAFALIGQVYESTYIERLESDLEAEESRLKASGEEIGHWERLAYLKPGSVLIKAIDLNPDDVDLLDFLVESSNLHPDAFEHSTGNAEERTEALQQQVHSRVLRVKDNTDSHSHFVRYKFDVNRDRAVEAITRLASMADQAEQRLIAKAESTSEAEPVMLRAGHLPDEYWDYLLLAEVAARIQDSSPDISRRYFDLLIKNQIPFIPKRSAENIYFASGKLALKEGDQIKAIEIWEKGIDDVNPYSLVLLGPIAQLEIALDQAISNDTVAERSKKAAESVERFKKAIEINELKLAQTPDWKMSRVARMEFIKEIKVATWRMENFDAILRLQSGETQKAIDSFSELLSDGAEVTDEERIEAALRLAALYESQGTWDAAAVTIEHALTIDPEDSRIRALAANAWAKSGNRDKARQQWRNAANSNSLPLKMAGLEAQFDHQLSLAPFERDFSGIRSSTPRIRELIVAAQTTGENDPDDSNQQLLRRLEIVEASIPPQGVEAETFFQSPEYANSIASLAEKHSDNLYIQSFAAERLANVGSTDFSNQALERLESMLGKDSIAVTLSRAKIEAIQGRYSEASQMLLELPPDDSSDIANIRMTAARYAQKANDIELAFQALESIPESKHTPATLFAFAQLTRSFPEDSDVFQKRNTTREEFNKKLRLELGKLEGESGSYGQYLEATDLIRQLRTESNKIERTDPRLQGAKKIVQDLVTKRPRWGAALSLVGWLSAIDGRHEESVNQLRRGIAAGDRRLPTRRLLWEQLVILNRPGEAEDEINRADWSTEDPIDKYSAKRIQLAQRQDDFDRSMNLAREGVSQRPDDFISYIVLAQTATLAARNATVVEERASLLKESQEAIDQATSLAGEDEFPIRSASLTLKMVQGDPQAVLEEVDLIEKSQLEEFNRTMLMARGLIGIREYKKALPLMKKGVELRPGSQTYLALANLYRELKQPTLEVTALEEASRSEPGNAILKNRLAIAKATLAGKDVNWAEIGELLDPTDQSANSNRFTYAIILNVHGDAAKKEKALEIFRELVSERNSRSNDAARVLATLLQDQIRGLDNKGELSNADKKLRVELDSEIRTLYGDLSLLVPTESIDLYRYANYLLTRGDEDDLNRVKSLYRLLQKSNNGTLAALEIGVRLAEKEGQESDSPQIVAKWAKGEKENGVLEKGDVSTIAGSSLVELGFVNEGLKWFEEAYQEDPTLLRNYVIVLNRVSQLKLALELCMQHHREHSDIESVILLIETMLNAAADDLVTEEHQALVKKTLDENSENPALLESVATLRMQEQDYESAVDIYQRIDQIEPNRIRTLNNLAMAFSELKGNESGGIEPIERAIKIAGEHPELLDTYGVVLLRSGKTHEAEKAFLKATEKSDEPRFKFHLILTLLEQNKVRDAKLLWERLDLERLDLNGLTLSERKRLARMKEEFGPGKQATAKGPTRP